GRDRAGRREGERGAAGAVRRPDDSFPQGGRAMRRVVIVLADGLLPDAISPSVMPSLDALGGAFTLALHARTVRPSTTVAALASLATGVAPHTHRLTEPGLGFLSNLRSLRPVAVELARGGIPTDVVTGELGPAALPVAWSLAATAG